MGTCRRLLGSRCLLGTLHVRYVHNIIMYEHTDRHASFWFQLWYIRSTSIVLLIQAYRMHQSGRVTLSLPVYLCMNRALVWVAPQTEQDCLDLPSMCVYWHSCGSKVDDSQASPSTCCAHNNYFKAALNLNNMTILMWKFRGSVHPYNFIYNDSFVIT